jgi:hypothetical protein
MGAGGYQYYIGDALLVRLGFTTLLYCLLLVTHIMFYCNSFWWRHPPVSGSLPYGRQGCLLTASLLASVPGISCQSDRLQMGVGPMNQIQRLKLSSLLPSPCLSFTVKFEVLHEQPCTQKLSNRAMFFSGFNQPRSKKLGTFSA